MADTHVRQRVIAMIVDTFSIDSSAVTPDLEFGAIDAWDSIGHINLMLELETRFKVDVSPDAIAELLSVSRICSWLEAGL